MGLKEQLMEDYKTAMKEHDVITKETVNLVRAAVKQHEVDMRVVLDDDADIVPIIKKQVKMRTDALDDFERAGRSDLVDSYKKEIAVLKKYLPEEMSEEEIKDCISRIAEASGFDKDMKNMGKLMKETMSELKNKADGSTVSKLVKEFLS